MPTARVNNLNITKKSPGVSTNTAEVLQNIVRPLPESLTPIEPPDNALNGFQNKINSSEQHKSSGSRIAALPSTKDPPKKEEINTTSLMQKAQSMPDLLQKYNINEVDPKLETEAEK